MPYYELEITLDNLVEYNKKEKENEERQNGNGSINQQQMLKDQNKMMNNYGKSMPTPSSFKTPNIKF